MKRYSIASMRKAGVHPFPALFKAVAVMFSVNKVNDVNGQERASKDRQPI